ncbi:MAG TPA: hypothetical protein VF439_03305 [Candidatus Paceibacterota bacterium]
MTATHHARRSRKPCEQGFIALVSAIILSLVLLAAVTGMSARSLYARQGALDSMAQAGAREAALGCASVARLALTANRAYAGGTSLSIGSDACTISTIGQHDGAYSFTVRSVDGLSTAALSISLSDEDLSIRRIAEISGAPP